MVEAVMDDIVLYFTGSNWEDLDRIIALARFTFLQDDDYDENPARQCAYLARQFRGAALDWAALTITANPAAMQNFDGYVLALKQAFGVEANNITALRRKALDDLRWSDHVPTFFTEFDRLTVQLGIHGHSTKISMVRSKLPAHIIKLLAEQALDFHNYETMRERLNTMWALDPTRHGSENTRPGRAPRPKCGACGKKGHTAKDCRSVTKN